MRQKMKKVILNKCFGGFGVSKDGIVEKVSD